MMISMDDPEHQRRRSLVNRGFTPKRVADHEARIRAHLQRDHRPGVRARRVRLRLGHRRAAPAAAHRRHARLRARARTTTCCAGPTTSSAPPPPTPTPEIAEPRRCRPASGSASCSSASSPTGGRSRRRPTSISMLCHAEIDGERLDDESIVQETLLILIGGDETTPPRDHRRACSRCSSTPTSATILRDDPARDADRASRSCCAGCRRSRTWRAPSSHDVELRGRDAPRRATR